MVTHILNELKATCFFDFVCLRKQNREKNPKENLKNMTLTNCNTLSFHNCVIKHEPSLCENWRKGVEINPKGERPGFIGKTIK